MVNVTYILSHGIEKRYGYSNCIGVHVVRAVWGGSSAAVVVVGGLSAAVGGETEGALSQRWAAAVSPEHLGQMDPVMQLEAGGLGRGRCFREREEWLCFLLAVTNVSHHLGAVLGVCCGGGD